MKDFDGASQCLEGKLNGQFAEIEMVKSERKPRRDIAISAMLWENGDQMVVKGEREMNTSDAGDYQRTRKVLACFVCMKNC